MRLDHFRGFSAYWEVPAGAATARDGRWVNGPGLMLFMAIRHALGEVALVAEDLGVLTDDVRRLLETLGLPGMKVLQFAFGELDSEHLPHHHVPNSVVYTGTHDNDTTPRLVRGAPRRREGALLRLLRHERRERELGPHPRRVRLRRASARSCRCRTSSTSGRRAA